MNNFEYYKDEIKCCGIFETYLNHIDTKVRYSVDELNKAIDWLCEEHKEPILDEMEREYLSNVIKPFRDKVIYINKLSRLIRDGEYAELIVIYTKQYLGYQYIYLPEFKGGTMYKGMELRKKYTLKELKI